jgi:hypothetical protein
MESIPTAVLVDNKQSVVRSLLERELFGPLQVFTEEEGGLNSHLNQCSSVDLSLQTRHFFSHGVRTRPGRFFF